MTGGTRAAVRILTERDLSILCWVGLFGVASLDQLTRQFWAGGRVATAQGRLDQLVAASYLHTQWSQYRGAAERVYALAARGCTQLPRVVQERVHIGYPPSGAVRQQLLAADAYLQLTAAIEAQGGQVLDWHSEWELRKEYNRAVALADRRGGTRPGHELADAQFRYRTAAGQEVSIDIEIDGYYYGAMLKQKAARYGKTRRVIYWICEANRVPRVRTACAPYSNIRIWSLG